MDFYLFSLILGALGLVAMALSGLSHGHAGHGGHGHGHDVGDVSLHAGHGHGGAAHHAGHHGAHGHGAGHHDTAQGGHGWVWQFLSPRMLFSVLTGLGATGLLAEPLLGGVLLLLLALAGGIAFELLAVRPIWNFFFRFASAPALTLESALYDTGTAVTRFDETGSGVIALEVDGQVLQVLAKLKPEDRDRGLRVRAGDRVLVEEVDGARNRCVVSWAGPSDASGGKLTGELGR
ncbi:MAG: hypothetical protein ICV87_10705 [Gemmatimonadetes bacterium]|nr:hypothetical protein [Gemmatimonadota bacterium]